MRTYPLLAILLLWSSPALAQSQTRVLLEREPAPFSGVLLPEEAAKRLVQDLNKYRTLSAEVETLKAALAASERENEALRQTTALADQMVARVEKSLAAYDAALARSTAIMERQEKRIEQLESREKFSWLLGGLGLIIAVAFALF